MLSRVPVHELKIDRSFVTAMETSAGGRGRRPLHPRPRPQPRPRGRRRGRGERTQRRTLWEMGCAAGQGHLFARPLPAAALLAALQRGSGGRPGTLAPPLHDPAR